MTFGILLFQAFIVVTLLVVKGLGSKYLVTACIIWTIFTLVMVFTSPLILLQLLTIWVTYSLLSRQT